MVIVFCSKTAILSPTQVPWGKSRTFYKQQRLEMLHTSRRFSGTRRGSQGFKGIWVLSETVRQEMKANSQSTDCIHVFCSLMSKTVNPNHQDELGYTPLHHAALSGHRYINYEGIYIITEFVTAFKLILLCHLLK